MYLIRSLRTFIGTNAERVAAGLSAFLAGDEFIETDTSNKYLHDGMAWRLEPAGSPGGSDTQVQFNDGGGFGGDSGFTYDPTTDILELITTAVTNGHISLVNETAASFANNYQIKSTLVNSAAEQVVYSQIIFGNNGNTDGSENGTIDLNTLVSGTMRSRMYLLDTKTIFNENSQNIDFIVKGTGGYGAGVDGILKVDVDAGAVLFSYSAPGDMFNFSDAGIIFNDGEADIDIRWAGDGVTNGYFYDAGNNRHGFNTGAPSSTVHIVGNTTIEVATQKYLITGRTDRLAFVGQSTGVNAGMEFFTFDGDGTDNLAITMYGVGSIANITNRERMFFNYSPATAFQIYSEAAGTGTLRPIRIGMSTIPTQLELQTNGNVNLGATTGVLVANRLTTTQQNALTAIDGMIYYNTTTGKFRGRAAGAWVDLH